MPKNLRAIFLGLGQGLSDLDAAALAAAAGMNLRLDHDALGAAAKQASCHIQRLFKRIRHFTLGNSHAIALKDVFCLILVNFHTFGLWTELPY